MKIARISPLLKLVVKTVSVPGSKSYTNRALLLASLVKGTVTIVNPLISDDTIALLNCLQTLGIAVSQTKNEIVIKGDISKIKNKEYLLNCDLSGTTMRFLLAFSCIIPGTKILTGSESLCKRPIKDLVDALEKMGAKIEYLENKGYPPVKIVGTISHSQKLSRHSRESGNPGTINNIDVISLNGNISSQFLSALLLIAPTIGLTIIVENDLVSKPYIAMTLDVLKHFGIEVKNEDFKKFIVTKQKINAKEYIVEADFSSASYFGAIAALTKSEITIQHINPNSLQADKEFFSILEQMGNNVMFNKNSVTVKGKTILPITVDMQHCPDQIQTLAVLAAFAKGKTVITGAESLAVKETNRLMALKQELAKMGIIVETAKNSLTIFGGNPKPATIETYNDHRMAMAFAVAATVLPNMQIKNPEVVTKTFPTFWEVLQKAGIKVTIEEKSTQKIVLIGFMGAGKSTVAPLLAKRLKTDVLEMDTEVLKRAKQKSIKNIFEKLGEQKFRKLENETAQKIVNKKAVISAGGGVVENCDTMMHLSKNATVVFLQTQFETILNRLINTQDRPLWKDTNKTKKLFETRQTLYKQYADIIITTDGKSLGQITTELEEALVNI